MDINFYIQPRQTGKTTKATNKYIQKLEKGESVLFLVMNNITKRNVLKEVNIFGQVSNIVSIEDFLKNMSYPKVQNLILDEWLYWDKNDRRKLVHLIKNTLEIDKVYVYTTSRKTYSRKMFNFCKDFKSKEGDRFSLIEKFEKEFNKSLLNNEKEELKELFSDLITEPTCKIIDNDYYPNNLKIVKKQEKLIGIEKAQTELYNVYLSREVHIYTYKDIEVVRSRYSFSPKTVLFSEDNGVNWKPINKNIENWDPSWIYVFIEDNKFNI